MSLLPEISKSRSGPVVLGTTRGDADLTPLSAGRWIAVFALVALLIRAAIGLQGGIWADESFLLLIVQAPSWNQMLSFLRLHESHPPLFYGLMRAWSEIVGSGDDKLLLVVPILIGVMLIPAIYLAGASLFNARVGFLAAGMAAVSPSLSEHSAQIRPYGLLPLLVLGSCYFMIAALQRGGLRNWVWYAVTTVLLLYTHHWAWLVVVGEHAAAGVVIAGKPPTRRQSTAREWIVVWAVILTAYLPWMSTLVAQATHAGHAPVAIDGPVAATTFVLLGITRAFETLFLGTLLDSRMVIACAAIAAVVAGRFAMLRIRRNRRSRAQPTSRDATGIESVSTTALRVLVMIPSVAVGAALTLSARSNMLLDRCVVMLAPIALLVLAHWMWSQWISRNSRVTQFPEACVLLGLVLTVSALGIRTLVRIPRSNAREVAAFVQWRALPTDLVVFAPEWFAPSFNRYFSRSIEQAVYPYANPPGMVDFSNIWTRTIDTTSLRQLRARVAASRLAGRRIWLISESRYTQPITEAEIASAYAHRQPGPVAILRVGQIRDMLEDAYGPADSSLVRSGTAPLYDQLTPYLYSPTESEGLRAR